MAALAIWLGGCIQELFPQTDDVQSVWAQLQSRREALLSRQAAHDAEQAAACMRVGLWDEAALLLGEPVADSADLDWWTTRAHWHWLNNNFTEAQAIVNRVLQRRPQYHPALLLNAQLHIEAWRLAEAEQQCASLKAAMPGYLAPVFLQGRIRILQKRYEDALQTARQLEAEFPESAEGWLLEAEAWFWLEKPANAEAALRACLARDPFSPDARFHYGYAIWRSGDATRLPEMAAQWELALAIHPLHYHTHWHWGNGHTHLSYAAYADTARAEIEQALEAAEQAFRIGQLPLAIERCRQAGQRYPESVLPDMMRASFWYMSYGPNRQAALDSSLRIFQEILAQKPHYGPAHNGIAAVIKQQRIPFLAAYDSLKQSLESLSISPADMARFQRVFPDMAYYPGQRVQRMIWQQLHSTRAYLPLLAKQGLRFVIPPLHVDLAQAMQNPWFRTGVTFDNRQWMDIRGVGSGAAGIEYVERAAWLERSVPLHEFVHLFHSRVFSEAEQRRVRQLYLQAMAEGRALDYYAANNEHEYLAQAIPAYFDRVKVHPLNHKAVATRAELIRKDPELFAFIDSLVLRQNADLSGNDPKALAENWAQVYMQLAERSAADDSPDGIEHGIRLADTALLWSPGNIPARLLYATLLARRGSLREAAEMADLAQQQSPGYAPGWLAMAQLMDYGVYAQAAKAGGADPEAWRRYCYQKAMELERDTEGRQNIHQAWRDYALGQGRYHEAVEVAEKYARSVQPLSTYLRDQRREALAFAAMLRANWGDVDSALAFFARETPQHAQDFELQQRYAEVLVAAGRYPAAIALLRNCQSLLSLAGRPDRNISNDIAFYLSLIEDSTAQRHIPASVKGLDAPYRYIESLIRVEKIDEAREALAALKPESPRERAAHGYAEALLLQRNGKLRQALGRFEEALALDPYHRDARMACVGLAREMGRTAVAERVAGAALELPLTAGPSWRKWLGTNAKAGF